VKISHFRQIRAWQSARELVTAIYRGSMHGPLAQDHDLRRQLRRAAVSTMTNIAEGFARGGDVEFARFLDIARASASEVESLLVVCEDLGLFASQDLASLTSLTQRTLSQIAGFQGYLRNPRANESSAEYLV